MKYPGLIKQGSLNGVAIKEIKKRLVELGFGAFDLNNPTFGVSTTESVKRFQKSKQLLDDGVVGEMTWERLFEIKGEKIPSSKNLAQRAREIIETQLHVREKTGKNDGVEVEEYLRSVGLGKGYSWCMALVYWAYERASKELGVKNPLIKTGGVLRQWNEIEKKYKVTVPQENDIFIMDFGKGAGHTGIVTKVITDRIHTVEGNTGSDPSTPAADREGNGVFNRSRKKSSINKGYIRIV